MSACLLVASVCSTLCQRCWTELIVQHLVLPSLVPACLLVASVCSTLCQCCWTELLVVQHLVLPSLVCMLASGQCLQYFVLMLDWTCCTAFTVLHRKMEHSKAACPLALIFCPTTFPSASSACLSSLINLVEDRVEIPADTVGQACTDVGSLFPLPPLQCAFCSYTPCPPSHFAHQEISPFCFLVKKPLFALCISVSLFFLGLCLSVRGFVHKSLWCSTWFVL